MRKVNLLIVEDDMDYAHLEEFIISNIENYDFKIQFAKNLSMTLDLVKSKKFDLIILDLILPDSEGLNSLKQIKKIDSDTPVIVVSGLEDEEIQEKSLVLGAEIFIRKKNYLGESIIKNIVALLESKSRV